MTLEEAKQLKPGDKVLIEAEVVQEIDEDLDLYLLLKSTEREEEGHAFLEFEYITEKVTPVRR